MMVLMALAMGVTMAVAMFVPVVPKLGFVEQKEKHQTQQQRHKQLLGWRRTFKGLGKQVQKSSAQQGSGCQAQHVLGVAGQQTKA
jgi:hypothetical protein